MAETNRERRKQELRRRMLDFAALEERDRQKESRDKEKRRQLAAGERRLRAICFFFLGLVLFLILLLFLHFLLYRCYRRSSVNWSRDFRAERRDTDNNYESYLPYGEGMLRITRDGASYLGLKGKQHWNQAFEMNQPFVSVNGDFAAVAEQGGNAIYIMAKSGPTGSAKTSLPITKLTVSGKGVVYAVLEDRNASYISVFTKEGRALDISIKSVLKGDGYPLDLSVSPDGTELMVSYVFLENGSLKNKIVFYNLSEAGRDAGASRVVGGFTNGLEGHLAGRVHFSDAGHAEAFHDGGILFYSTKQPSSPVEKASVQEKSTIRAIAWGDRALALITDSGRSEASSSESESSEESTDPSQEESGASQGEESGAAETEGKTKEKEKEKEKEKKKKTEPYRLKVYDLEGRELLDRGVSLGAEGLSIDGDKVFLYHDTALLIYDIHGRLRFRGELDLPIESVRATSSFGPFGGSILVGSDGILKSVRLR